MSKKANELIRLKKDLPKVVWNVSSIYDKLHFDNILPTEAILTNRLCRKSISKKKIQIKAWYRILDTEILSYEKFHWKAIDIQKIY